MDEIETPKPFLEWLEDTLLPAWTTLSVDALLLLGDAGCDVSDKTSDSIGVWWLGLDRQVREFIVNGIAWVPGSTKDDMARTRVIELLEEAILAHEQLKLEIAHRLSGEDLDHPEALFSLNIAVAQFHERFLVTALSWLRPAGVTPALATARARRAGPDSFGADVFLATRAIDQSIGSLRKSLDRDVRSARKCLQDLRAEHPPLPVPARQLHNLALQFHQQLEHYDEDLERIVPTDLYPPGRGLCATLDRLVELLLQAMRRIEAPMTVAAQADYWPLLLLHHQGTVQTWNQLFDIAEQTFDRAGGVLGQVGVCLQLAGRPGVTIPEWPTLKRPHAHTSASANDLTHHTADGSVEGSARKNPKESAESRAGGQWRPWRRQARKRA